MNATFFANHFVHPSVAISGLILAVGAVAVGIALFFAQRTGVLEWDAKRIFATMVRLFVIALCLLAVSRPHWTQKRRREPWVVFLVDNSLSMEGTQPTVEAYIRHRTEGLEAGRFAVMGFSDSANLFQSWQEAAEGFPAIPWENFVGARDITDIEGGVAAALNILPPYRENSDIQPMISLITDGNENRASLRRAAASVREAHVYFEAVAPIREATGELSVQRLILPEGMRLGEPFSMALVAYNDNPRAVEAFLTLKKDGVEVWNQPVPIPLFPGKNLIDYIPVLPQSDSAGYYFYEAALVPSNPQEDAFDANNHSAQILRLDDLPDLYIVEGSGGSAQQLIKQAWAERLTQLKSQVAATVPESVLALLPYDCVVLADVQATRLSHQAMQALRTYVEEFGGGLIVIGGQNSFEHGGYKGTILEELLPVEVGKPKKGTSTGLVVLLIDFSSSMRGSGLNLAKLSALETVKNLPDGLHVEIIAFDTQPHLQLSPTELNANTRPQMLDKIRRLRSGAGTVLGPALVRSLNDAKAFIQSSSGDIGARIIIFTDGRVNRSASAYQQIIDQHGNKKIQVNCLGLGQESGGDPLAAIARRGGGKYKRFLHRGQKVPLFAFDPDDMLGKRQKKYKPIWTGEPMLKGFPMGRELPFSLKDYNQMTLKPEGHLSLYIPREKREKHTLLAWRYNGLGRVAAFGSDASGVWSSGLVSSSYYNKLFLQMLTFIRRSELANSRIEAQQESNGNIRLRMTTNELETRTFFATLFFSDSPNAPLKRRTVKLAPVQPGGFAGIWHVKEGIPPGGVYPVLIQKQDPNGVETLYAEASVYINPVNIGGELAKVQPNVTLLEQAAVLTDGRLLSTNDTDVPFPRFEGNFNRELIQPPYAYLFGALLILLLFADIGIRAGKFQRG